LNFDQFLDALFALERTISITSPVAMTVRRTYWGAPTDSITDLPCIINTLAETDRTLGMGTRREENFRIIIQFLAVRAMPEDERSSRIATAFWFAAKNAFDANTTISGTVTFSTLRGADSTVPVILQHGGLAYVGFDGFLEAQNVQIA